MQKSWICFIKSMGNKRIAVLLNKKGKLKQRQTLIKGTDKRRKTS